MFTGRHGATHATGLMPAMPWTDMPGQLMAGKGDSGMKKIKKLVLGTVAGGILFASGCLGNVPWRAIIWDAALYTGYEYLLDNDASPINFDFFEDSVVNEGG